MRSIKDIDVDNKKVLVRVDFNVPLGTNGEIEDDFRIKAHLETIKYLKEDKARTILISHLGKPKGKEQKFSLEGVAKRLSELLNFEVKFAEDCLGEKAEKEINNLEAGDVLLLENLRFYPEEEENDKQFAATLSRMGDIFVEDAFSVCHRNHASVTGIPQFIPSYAGLLFEKEVFNLQKINEDPKHPFIVIIGGAKIETKIGVIEYFLNKADAVLLGGKIANEALKLKGLYGTQEVRDKAVFEATRNIDVNHPKLLTPIDGLIGKMSYSRVGSVDAVREDEDIFDIGPQTIEIYQKIIGMGKTIVWNGPMGKTEEEVFTKGTKAIADKIGEGNNFSVVGGGETIDFIHQFKLEDKFDFLSSGGGAMLEFISGKELPGILALNKDYDR